MGMSMDKRIVLGQLEVYICMLFVNTAQKLVLTTGPMKQPFIVGHTSESTFSSQKILQKLEEERYDEILGKQPCSTHCLRLAQRKWMLHL
jgi:hypothetical protein